MSSHSPPTMALVMPVETRLWQLVGEIEAIASEVSDAALTAAARRLELLVARDEPARSRATPSRWCR